VENVVSEVKHEGRKQSLAEKQKKTQMDLAFGYTIPSSSA